MLLFGRVSVRTHWLIWQLATVDMFKNMRLTSHTFRSSAQTTLLARKHLLVLCIYNQTAFQQRLIQYCGGWLVTHMAYRYMLEHWKRLFMNWLQPSRNNHYGKKAFLYFHPSRFLSAEVLYSIPANCCRLLNEAFECNCKRLPKKKNTGYSYSADTTYFITQKKMKCLNYFCLHDHNDDNIWHEA